MPRDLQRFWKFCFAIVVSRGNEKSGFWFIMGGRGFIVWVGATAAVKIRWFSQVYLDCSRAPRQGKNRRRAKAKTHAVLLYGWKQLKSGGRDGER